jgi:MmyB-like transcription regulator ligand binding domain
MASPEFRTWWAEHDVATRNSGTKRYRHPVVGEMKIHFEAMRLADEDQLLFIYTVEPGTPSHDAMGLLATWAATQDAEAAHASTNVAVRRMSWNPYGPLALPLGAGL